MIEADRTCLDITQQHHAVEKAIGAAKAVWPASDPEVIAHQHHELAEDDPHWTEGSGRLGHRHTHAFVIDRLHPEWPREP